MNKKNWIRQISESYIRMNEMEETNPNQTNPSNEPFNFSDYYETERPVEEMLPRVPDNSFEALLIYLEVRYLLTPAALNWIRAWVLSSAIMTGAGGAVGLSLHIGGLIAYLVALGFTVEQATQIARDVWNALQEFIDDLYREEGQRRVPKHLRRNFDNLVVKPDVDVPLTPSMLPPNSPTGPMLPGQTYPGQHPIGPNGLPYIPTATQSGSYPPGSSNPIRM